MGMAVHFEWSNSDRPKGLLPPPEVITGRMLYNAQSIPIWNPSAVCSLGIVLIFNFGSG